MNVSHIKWWDAREEEHLRHLWEVEKLSVSQIAQLTGRTRGSVIGKIHRMKCENRSSPMRQYKEPDLTCPKNVVLSLATKRHAKQGTVPTPQEMPTDMTLKDAEHRRIGGKNGNKCLFPVGDIGQKNFHSCGKPILQIAGASPALRRNTQYCKKHMIVMFGKIPDPTQNQQKTKQILDQGTKRKIFLTARANNV